MDLSEKVFLLAYDITTRASLGMKTKAKGTVTRLIKQCSTLGTGLNFADLYPSIKMLPLITGLQFKVHRIYRKTRAAFDTILAEHRAAIAPETTGHNDLEDLKDVLLKLQHQGDGHSLSNGNIIAVIMVNSYTFLFFSFLARLTTHLHIISYPMIYSPLIPVV